MMQRTSEIGVRMAMGAQPEQGVRLMLSDGLRPALYGLTLDLAASIGAVRLIQAMLYGTRPPGQGIELFGLRASDSLRERFWVHTAIAQYWRQSLRNIFSNALG
jgi:ABC-type lipoprotein release transport system permease subunit